MTTEQTTSPEALTRVEARERARLLSDFTYTTAIDLTKGDETFGAEVTIAFDCSEPGAATFVDYTARSVETIELNGTAIDPATASNGHRIQLEGLKAKNTLRIVGASEYSRSGTGLHLFRDPVDNNPYLHTQFEAREAHKCFACFDQPDLKGTFELTVRAPADWIVVSNTEPATDDDGDAKVWRFARTKTMSTYLGAIIAGPYHAVFDQHGDIKLGIYIRQSLAQYLDHDEIFTVTKQGFDFFTKYFDYPYVWGKYDQLFVPEFNSGAMENCGAVTFNESYIFRSKVTDAAREGRAGTILHEMAHMWFGDLVTMDWWDDLWLNESFATYMGTLSQSRATRWTDAWTRFAQGQKLWAMIQDQMPTTHPIVADVPDTEAARTNFDGISYAKGASALKQLVAWVGEEAFTKGIRQYFRDYEFGNASLTEFLAALEKASGRNLTAWAQEWLETAGVNTFRARFETDGDKYTSFALDQTATEEQPTLRSHRIALGLYDFDGKALKRRRRVELDAVGVSIDVPDLVGEKVPDLLLINDDDLAYTKIRLDERSLATVTEHLATLDDPLARTLVWSATVDQLRDAELAARDFFRLVMNNVHVETDPGTIQQLLANAAGAYTSYGDPANRGSLRLQLATRALEELRKAEPGSDLQLIWARTFIGAARTDEHLAAVRGLLDGKNPFDGLNIDTELRWLIVNSLASLGAIGDDVIAAELERDPTDQGQRHAASAESVRPTPEAKEEAWTRIVEDDSISFYVKVSYTQGFGIVDQAELIEPYVNRYFDQLRPMWDSKPPEVAAFFCRSMYPRALMNEGIIATTHRYLEDNGDLAWPMRRALIESKDQLERALRGQALDIEAGKRAKK